MPGSLLLCMCARAYVCAGEGGRRLVGGRGVAPEESGRRRGGAPEEWVAPMGAVVGSTVC